MIAMALRLCAKAQREYLEPREVVNRINTAFAYVEVSEEAGRKHVDEVITQLQSMMRDGTIPQDSHYIARMKRMKDEAVFVYFGDNPGIEEKCLNTTIIPGEPLYFHYSSPEHETAAQPLLERCAVALGYDIEADNE
jgi:hypothetical protein